MKSVQVGEGEFPRLEFPVNVDEREEDEAEARGFFSGVRVFLGPEESYPLYFYDPVALAQDVAGLPRWGGACIAEVGLVVVPSITLACMKRAVEQLVREGYFKHLRPV